MTGVLLLLGGGEFFFDLPLLFTGITTRGLYREKAYEVLSGELERASQWKPSTI